MFTWICPQCGNEVPPSQTECQRCAKAAQAQQSQQPPAVSPPAPQAPPNYAPPQAQPMPPAPSHAMPQPQMPPQPSPPVPQYHAAPPEAKSTWVRDLLITVGVAGVLLGAGYLVWNRMDKGEAGSASSPELEKVTAANAKAHPLSKHIELTGFRLREPKPGRVEVKLVLVNHGAAEIANLQMQVVLIAKGTEKQVAAFPLAAKKIAPFSSAELTTLVNTSMRAYELPDWQFIEPRFSIEAP
jgi:hypothetical protein